MQFAAGTRLGADDVIGLIGAGGMGEIYRAETGSWGATWPSRSCRPITMRTPLRVEAGSLRAENPQPWANVTVDGSSSWDLHPDGKRVLMRLSAQNTSVNDHINLVFNALTATGRR